MQARAQKKYIRTSPRKMRLVIDLIRGKKAYEALNILRFSKQNASVMIELTLKSALSNLNNKAEEKELTIDDSEVIVKEVFSNAGPTMKRIQPAPMGRAFRVRKRTNHLTVIVEAPGIGVDNIDDNLELAGETATTNVNNESANELNNNKE